MKTSELDFILPQELIAQHPAHPADQARLMIVNRKDRTLSEDTFFNLDRYLQQGDLVVFNNSKVLPARLIGEKQTGGKVELLFLKQLTPDHWETLVHGGKELIGKTITLSKKLTALVEEQTGDTFRVHFNLSSEKLLKEILKIGKIPTPPYIKEVVNNKDYQTIYADKLGSAAAPTAGLHFTKRLMKKLHNKGIESAFVTLHVGLGTFQPIKTEVVEDHPIHSEYFEIDLATIKQINNAKKEGRRVIAVGTTSCRVLESIYKQIDTPSTAIAQETSIFIFPGYSFKIIDGLITNFHTPHSSLLALVMALAGEDLIKNAYKKAVQEDWKFFSLGDGMIIL